MDWKTNPIPRLLTCAILFQTVSSYPTYVPNSPDVCSKMIPGHGPRPQTSPAPYEIILNKQSVMGGNNLQIIIQAKKGRTFKGFYMQVRDIDGIPLGTFLSQDENESGTHGCFNHKNNAIHHKNRNDKRSITVYWKAPENFEGQVRVLATVLKDFETYWTNIQAPDAVSVSNISSKVFIASPQFPEKATDSKELSQTNRILNYNPYSPFSPISFWDPPKNSSELLSQPSDKSSLTAEGRQLINPGTFDFHGGLNSYKYPPRKPKQVYPDDYHHYPTRHVGPSSINEQLPPLPHEGNHIVKPILSKPSLFNKHKSEIKERYPSHAHPKQSYYPYNYPPIENDNPYPFHDPNSIDSNPNDHFGVTPTKLEDPYSYAPHQPHYTQSVYDNNNGHYIINHHYLSHSPNPIAGPPLHSPHKLHFPKPASDPSYPNAGYFPKDILTKLTSYIPNIYNAMMNNPLLNFNIENTIESIWKPSKGIPHKSHQFLPSASSPHKLEMPRYGYLIYNPVRGNPYYVIPASNEDDFIAHHMSPNRRLTKT